MIPVLYSIVLIRLGGRLTAQDNESFEEGEVLGQILVAVGCITLITATFSQLCEITSRMDRYNPKVVVTEQDTFVQRQSVAKTYDEDIYFDQNYNKNFKS